MKLEWGIIKMTDNGRIKNTLRNTVVGIGGQFFTYCLTFIYRTVFIYVLGASYLGVQGLFGNILSMLSLAELGIGNAIIFSLYKPLAKKDEQTVSALMNFYAKAYRIIGIVVATLGIGLIPFIDILIKDKPGIPNITFIYLLFLLDAVFSYFFAYKKSIIIADQKGYINTLNTNVFSLLRIFVQIFLLIQTKNFILVLIIQVIFTLLSNISISLKADKLYPFLNRNKNSKLDIENRKDLIKKIRALMYHQFGSVAVLSTDNLLISAYVGLYYVGLYANYVMIINIIGSIIRQFTESIMASIGNLTSKESIDKAKSTFNLLTLINYWIYAFCSISIFTLLNPFITLWIGKEYLFNIEVVAILVLNFYLTGMRQNVLSFRNSLGLFWNDRYKPLIEAIINLVVSIILVKQYGIAGIFLGTLVSTVTTSVWVEPFILFKYYFKEGLSNYFNKYIGMFILTILIAMLMQLISALIFTGTISSMILLASICFILPNTLFCLVYYKTNEFQSCISIIKKIISQLRINRRRVNEINK